jgi:hypothetical protein
MRQAMFAIASSHEDRDDLMSFAAILQDGLWTPAVCRRLLHLD